MIVIGSVNVDGDVGPGGDLHLCIPEGGDIGMGTEVASTFAPEPAWTGDHRRGSMTYKAVISSHLPSRLQGYMGTDGAALVDGNEDREGILTDEREDTLCPRSS